MEASQGPREADLAPAPAHQTTVAGWKPADPGPLGLGAFAATTFALSMNNSHLVGPAATPAVLSLALVYGGVVQLLAGMWEFRTGNTFGAVVFSSYGAFWIGVYLFLHNFAGLVAAHALPSALGLFLWTWTIFTVLLLIASLRTTGVVALTFLLLTITFIFLSIGASGASTSTTKIGGYFGLATAASAWYGSFAAVINSTFGRVVAPVFPLSR